MIDEGVKKFSSILAPLEFKYTSFKYIHVNLYKDDTLIYSMDVSKDTKPLELEFDIDGADTFSIELKYLTEYYGNDASIVFSDAKFE